MKYIELTRNKKAKVDDESFEFLNQWKWSYHSAGYAWRWSSTKINRKPILMHRLINKTPQGLTTDHINRDKLDNRKANLRTAEYFQNRMNSKMMNTNTSGYRGVVWRKDRNSWVAKVTHKGKRIYLGSSKSKIEAAEIYYRAATKLCGEFISLD